MQGSNVISVILINIIKNFWWVFLLLIIFAIIVEYLRSPKIKGKIAEKVTSTALSLKLDHEKYKIFKDLRVPDERGGTQIDLVVVSKYGIFVIEVKDYNGWIYANEKDQYWTQVLFKNKNKFQNPLRQNYRHVMALSEYLNLDKKYFHSLVFFSGDAKFKTPKPKNVITSGLSDYMKNFVKEILDENQLTDITLKLKQLQS